MEPWKRCSASMKDTLEQSVVCLSWWKPVRSFNLLLFTYYVLVLSEQSMNCYNIYVWSSIELSGKTSTIQTFVILRLQISSLPEAFISLRFSINFRWNRFAEFWHFVQVFINAFQSMKYLYYLEWGRFLNNNYIIYSLLYIFILANALYILDIADCYGNYWKLLSEKKLFDMNQFLEWIAMK